MPILPNRRKVLTGLGGGLLTSAATGAYAFAIEPRFRLEVTRYDLRPTNWIPGLNLRIAVLTDIHVCEPYMPLERVAEIVEVTNALQPDLILMLGDYPGGWKVTWKRVSLFDFARVASGLKAKLGVYSILGNHDWWDDDAALRARRGPVEAQRALEAHGIPVLENDVVRLEKNGQPFWIAGIGEQQPFRVVRDKRSLADIPKMLRQISDDAPAILMVHEPDIFPKVPDRFSVTLAGHTHGGQVRLFGYSPIANSRYRQRYVYGHVVEGARHLIVSGGLGVSGVGVRFGVPPEIVLLKLGAPPATS